MAEGHSESFRLLVPGKAVLEVAALEAPDGRNALCARAESPFEQRGTLVAAFRTVTATPPGAASYRAEAPLRSSKEWPPSSVGSGLSRIGRKARAWRARAWRSYWLEWHGAQAPALRNRRRPRGPLLRRRRGRAPAATAYPLAPRRTSTSRPRSWSERRRTASNSRAASASRP
jgi:hypothetical protein